MSDTVDTAQHTKTPCRNTIRARGYALTINNPTEEDIKSFKSLKGDWIYQIEAGANQTTHLQGFIYFRNAVSFSGVKKILKRAHIEIAKNRDACINYCQKADTRIEGPYSSNQSWIKKDQPTDTNDTAQPAPIKDCSYWLKIFTDALGAELIKKEEERDQRIFQWLKWKDEHPSDDMYE